MREQMTVETRSGRCGGCTMILVKQQSMIDPCCMKRGSIIHFSPVLTLLADKSAPQLKVVTVFESFKRLMEKLRSSSFRSRRVSLDPVLRNDPNLFHQLLPALSEMIGVLSLKCEEKDGKFDLCLASDPVKTSLALLVVLDALGDAIPYLKENKNYSEQIHSLPLLKMGRIHSGSVLASREEIPLGIATSAIDETRETKWEEPNGAKGILNSPHKINNVLTQGLNKPAFTCVFNGDLCYLSGLLKGARTAVRAGTS
ncbi:hypothetical protein MLD38_038676 [Melastoma candidum]|uniref:Uncharacterized protein n=1 Tax=Melastoma candidum TaxID=119954 RepID=A0ACB9L0E3_9MYRT|nr:hypothetical protein MLD38_038676 [Melastoma candidum]